MKAKLLIVAALLLAQLVAALAIPILPPAEAEDSPAERDDAADGVAEEMRFAEDIDRQFDVPESALRDVTFAAKELAERAAAEQERFQALREGNDSAPAAPANSTTTTTTTNSTAAPAAQQNQTAAGEQKPPVEEQKPPAPAPPADEKPPVPAPVRPEGNPDVCWRWLKPLSGGSTQHDRRRDLVAWLGADGSMAVYSGLGGGGVEQSPSAVKELEVFDPKTGSWLARPIVVEDSKPMLSTHAAFAVDAASGKVYEFGGTRAVTASNAVQITNLLGALELKDGAYTWSRVAHTNPADDENVPPALTESGMVFFKGVLLVFGGMTETARTNMLYMIRPGTWKWSRPLLNGRSPSARSAHAMVATGDAVYVYGGRDDMRFFGDLYRLTPPKSNSLDLEAWEWTQLSPGNPAFAPTPAARAFVNAVLLPGNRILLQGGANPTLDGFYSDSSVLDVSAEDGSVSWVTMPASLESSVTPQRRHRGAAVVNRDGTAVYFFGGCGKHECYDIFSPQPVDLDGVCKNKCQHGSFEALGDGTATCTCHDDWGGKFCAEKSSCPKDCTSPLHGKCVGGVCKCQPGFAGSACETPTCYDKCGAAEGRGACASSHCICRRGWFGLGCENKKCAENCNGRGICTPQLGTPLAQCKCIHGFSGAGCEFFGLRAQQSRPGAAASFLEVEARADNVTAEVQNTTQPAGANDTATRGTEVVLGGQTRYVADFSCPDNCAGNGICERTVDPDGNVRGVCKCAPGFAGLDCGGECTLHCTSPLHGKCTGDSALPTCECAVGYRGEGCQEAFCDRNCSAHGECSNGKCQCTSPWTGAACHLDGSCSGHGTFREGSYCECEPGYGGFDCSQQVTCAQGCGEFGVCVGAVVMEADKDKPVVGQCRCQPGYRGVQCEKKACPADCSKQGVCSEEGTCSCYSGYTGLDCAKQIICPNNCTGDHGLCVPNPANPESVTGVCRCNEKWSGDACQNLGCPGQCGHRGRCIEGQCLCDPGYSGLSCEVACPRKCADESGTPRGICVNSQCLCHPGFNGSDCSLPSRCPGDCSGNGECFQPLAQCFCKPGFTGPDCSVVSQCGPSQCSGKGTCMHGKCFCDPGFEGAHCERRASCTSDCNARGLCVNGQCFCNTGFAGASCELVANDPTCPKNCSGNGVCQYGRCFCVAGYAGDSCERPTLDDQCKRSANATDLCEGRGLCRFGECFCPPGYAGDFCEKEEVCPGGCIKDQGVCLLGECHCLPGFKGPDCSEDDVCEGTPLPCSGHGLCLQGSCACLPNYSGSACENVEVKGLESTCPNNCTDGGVCHLGRCFCIEGRDGRDCSVKTQDACPDGCNGKGLCRFGQCFCKPGYAGKACEQQLECSDKCLLNGVCAYGHCFCVPGYTGKDCDRPVDLEERRRVLERDVADAVALSQSLAPQGSPLYCYGGCGGHGTCINNTCFCAPGYYGSNCQTVEGGPLTHRCATNCNGHGQCLFGQCYCDGGFAGPYCNQTVVLGCRSNCNGRGTCYNGKCLCDLGFDGAACEKSSTCPEACEADRHGVCINGRCQCVRGYFGETCNQTNVYEATKASFREVRADAVARSAAASAGSEAGAASAGEAALDTCGGRCSSNGVCVESQCYCKAGWTGSDCGEMEAPALRSLSASVAGAALDDSAAATRSPTSYLSLSVLSFAAGIIVCLLGQVAWAKHKEMGRKRATKDIFKPLLHTLDQ